MPARRPRVSSTASLFAAPSDRQPLAARMRPRNLDEFAGQLHLVGPDGPFRRFVARRHLPSMVLWGPPGSGKTTLGRILAEAVGAEFQTLSAVLAGVADVRAVIADAQGRAGFEGSATAPTVLFIDEIHRFNRAQQDALLPHVEDGTVTLIGATTENAYLSVNPPLLSRLRVFRLEPLADDEVRVVVSAALSDARGLGGTVALDDEAVDFLVALAGGDARQALNLLEAASALAEAQGLRDDAGRVAPRRAELESAAQQRVAGYDLAGDRHYDTVSAFIKSIRGNDPDAALYWLAAMIEVGEDPRFIARRLVIAASEDVGNADPRALQVAVSAAQALEMIGLPEAQYALAQATAYLASAPKSNRAGRAYFAAKTDVDEHGALPVPLHLRNAPVSRMRSHGIGVGYLYPHDYAGADVEQQYLPDELVERRYYVPSDQGMEQQIAARLERLATARADASIRSRGRPKRRRPAGEGPGTPTA